MLPILRKNIEYVEVPIDKVLERFTLPKFQRNRDESHVDQLFQRFLSYYETNKDVVMTGSISVGIKTDTSEWIVFDGQHRLRALDRLQKIHPIHTCKIRIDIYHVDTEEQIFALYNIINTSEKVELYRGLNASTTAPLIEAWLRDKYGTYLKTSKSPNGLNVNMKDIMKRMESCGVLDLPYEDIKQRMEALIKLYACTSHDTWTEWGVDSRRLSLLNGANPFYFGLYRHYEWIPRLVDTTDVKHCAVHKTPRMAIPKRVRSEIWSRRYGDLKQGKDVKCQCCKSEITYDYFHVSHKISLAKGGTNDLNNLDVVCPTCNLDMGTMSIEQYTMLF